MKESTLEKITLVSMYILGFFFIALCLLLGWAIIEIVLWITSK
jgi:hypothetical protein